MKPTTKNKKNILIICSIVVLIAGVSLFAVLSRNSNDSPANKSDQQTTNVPDLTPATDKEKQQSEDAKDRILEQQKKQEEQKQTTGIAVTPAIVNFGIYDGSVEVSSYVSGVFEDGGTCTLLLTKNDRTVSKEVKGMKNATNTLCPTFYVPVSELSSGEWSFVVTYASASASGESQPKTIVIE